MAMAMTRPRSSSISRTRRSRTLEIQCRPPSSWMAQPRANGLKAGTAGSIGAMLALPVVWPPLSRRRQSDQVRTPAPEPFSTPSKYLFTTSAMVFLGVRSVGASGFTRAGSGLSKPLGLNSASSFGRNRVRVPPRGPVASSRTITASMSAILPASARSRSASIPGVPFSLTDPRKPTCPVNGSANHSL